MKKNPIAVVVIVAIIVGVIAFYAGTTMGKGSSTSGRRNFNPSGNGAGFARNGGSNGGFVNGKILKQDATSITVQMRDGTSRIVFLSDTTTVQKSVAGAVTDLSVGEQVRVTGKQSSDGTVAADNVQILPSLTGNPSPNPNVNSTPTSVSPSNSNANF